MINMLLVMCGFLMMMLLSKEIRPMSDVVLKEMLAGGRNLQRDFSSWEEHAAYVPLFPKFLKNTLAFLFPLWLMFQKCVDLFKISLAKWNHNGLFLEFKLLLLLLTFLCGYDRNIGRGRGLVFLISDFWTYSQISYSKRQYECIRKQTDEWVN